MEWMILPYRRYFEFSGRAQRKEYWSVTIRYVLVSLVFAARMVGVGCGLM